MNHSSMDKKFETFNFFKTYIKTYNEFYLEQKSNHYSYDFDSDKLIKYPEEKNVNYEWKNLADSNCCTEEEKFNELLTGRKLSHNDEPEREVTLTKSINEKFKRTKLPELVEKVNKVADNERGY